MPEDFETLFVTTSDKPALIACSKPGARRGCQKRVHGTRLQIARRHRARSFLDPLQPGSLSGRFYRGIVRRDEARRKPVAHHPSKNARQPAPSCHRHPARRQLHHLRPDAGVPKKRSRRHQRARRLPCSRNSLKRRWRTTTCFSTTTAKFRTASPGCEKHGAKAVNFPALILSESAASDKTGGLNNRRGRTFGVDARALRLWVEN